MFIYFLFNFFLFSIFGWILENIYSLFSYGHFQKDGFLNIPLKPMYGIAMSTLILFNETIAKNNYFFLLLCFIIPTSVEYITGKLMRNYFNKNYWDYSKCKFNIDGIVCVKFSIYWMILSYVGIIYIYPFIYNNLHILIYPYLVVTITLLSLILLIDTAITLRHFKLGTNLK